MTLLKIGILFKYMCANMETLVWRLRFIIFCSYMSPEFESKRCFWGILLVPSIG